MVIAMLDSSKFERHALLDAVPWEEVDLLVTDKGIPQEEYKRLKEQMQVVVVE
jgi:DeoR/GlpR family transcriptional regulator of sugar metabolism